MDPVRASAIGFVGSACLNYFANHRFTFASAESHARAGPKFAVLASLGLALNSEILALLIGAGFHYMVAQAAATVLVLLWNFVGNSLWTFRRSHRRAAAPS
jgi:putative flippase GtrA